MYEGMRSTRIKKYCSWVWVDRKHTDHHIRCLLSYFYGHMVDLSSDIVLLHVSRPLGASIGVMPWFSTIEASVIINCIWCLWCAILLWSIGDIILHRNIVGLLLVLGWCFILLLCMLWLLVVVDQTELTLVALLWLSLLRIGTEARVAPGLLSLELPFLVLHLTALVLNDQGFIH